MDQRKMLCGVLEPGSDFLGQAQLIHLVNEEREIQKSSLIWAHMGSGSASSRLGAGHLDP